MISQKFSVSVETEKLIECISIANLLFEKMSQVVIGDKNDPNTERVLLELMHPIYNYIDTEIMDSVYSCAYGEKTTL